MKNSRKSDPNTSRAAGEMANLTESQDAIKVLLENSEGPMTDEEIGALAAECDVPYSPSRLRTARLELVRAGKVTLTGERKNSRGRMAQTWQLA